MDFYVKVSVTPENDKQVARLEDEERDDHRYAVVDGLCSVDLDKAATEVLNDYYAPVAAVKVQYGDVLSAAEFRIVKRKRVLKEAW